MDGQVCSRLGEITGFQAKGQVHTQATGRTGSATQDNGGEKPAVAKTTVKARLCVKSSAERPGGSATFPSIILEVKKVCATPTMKRQLTGHGKGPSPSLSGADVGSSDAGSLPYAGHTWAYTRGTSPVPSGVEHT